MEFRHSTSQLGTRSAAMPAHRSGYDAHLEDCGEDVQKWTNADFEVLTRKVCRFAERHDIPILSTHGGGYKRPVAVEAAVRHGETYSHQ